MKRTPHDVTYAKELFYNRFTTILLEHRVYGNSAVEIANAHYAETPSESSISLVQSMIDYWHKNCTLMNCPLMLSYSPECEQCIVEDVARIVG